MASAKRPFFRRWYLGQQVLDDPHSRKRWRGCARNACAVGELDVERDAATEWFT